MSDKCWTVYRHKKRPDIRYYVETLRSGDTDTKHNPLSVEDGCVHLKTPRNLRFDTEDNPPHTAAEAGLWPHEKFMELYEEDDE